MIPLRAQAKQVVQEFFGPSPFEGLGLPTRDALLDALEAFAKRVQEDTREECAKVAINEEWWCRENTNWPEVLVGQIGACSRIAAAIRERGGQG